MAKLRYSRKLQRVIANRAPRSKRTIVAGGVTIDYGRRPIGTVPEVEKFTTVDGKKAHTVSGGDEHRTVTASHPPVSIDKGDEKVTTKIVSTDKSGTSSTALPSVPHSSIGEQSGACERAVSMSLFFSHTLTTLDRARDCVK